MNALIAKVKGMNEVFTKEDIILPLNLCKNIQLKY